MSAVMEVDMDVTRVPAGSVAMPHELRMVMERHLAGLQGLPTPEIVAAICKETEASFHKEKVLKYFLLESPLRARDLGALLCVIGKNRAAQLCREVAQMRERRLVRGKKPRWEEAKAS